MGKPWKLTMHWAVTDYEATEKSKKVYASITEGDGTQVLGDLPPEANTNTNHPYMAHVAGFNTLNIPMALAAMMGAKHNPFNSGSAPITEEQLDAFTLQVAHMCITYKIPIKPRRCFTHAEVEPQFGVPQNGKWDITWLPGMDKPGDAIEVGNHLRSMIQAHTDIIKKRVPKKRRFFWQRWF